MKVKVAVVGLGIGQTHLQHFRTIKGVEIVGVVDTDDKVRKAVADRYGVRGFASSEDLLDARPPDAVSICTPPGSHLKLTRIFAERKVHILCEKPMAPTIRDCSGMIAACRKNKVHLMIGFKKRFSPTYQFLKDRFSTSFAPPRWAAVRFALGRVDKKWFWDENDGGGPISENTVHVIDLLRFLMGEVTTVYAEGGNLFMPTYRPQIDSAVFTLKFASGAVASVAAGYASEWPVAKEEVSLASQKVVCEVKGPFDRPETLQYIRRNAPSKIYRKAYEEPDGFAGEIKHFVDCVRKGRSPAVSGEDGLAALRICLAVKRSIRSGRVVRLRE